MEWKRLREWYKNPYEAAACTLGRFIDRADDPPALLEKSAS